MPNLYALIMAGGGGTRLWPLSRKGRPKQMLPLTEERTMFQITVERLTDLLPPERIFVITGTGMAEALRESTPYIPATNVICEPFGRDSGPAAGLGLYTIAGRDPDAIVAVLSADHHIANEERFREALRTAAEVAERGYIVTLGIPPSYPATGFGYIQRGTSIGTMRGFEVFHSQRFVEKPDAATAQVFLQTGLYSWNAGMFIMTVKRAKEEFARQQPSMDALLNQVVTHPEWLTDLWGKMKKQPIDYAIMEGAHDVAVIPVDIGWSDVGSWATLFEILSENAEDNISRGDYHAHVQIDTRGTLIVSNRMVVTIGVNDLVIVDTDDVLMICHRDRAQDVREAVKIIEARGSKTHL
ncbi:MAG TPA: mannose-1-phosphate guanylyltransferase [Aggregatilineales bacterium]|nr:NTP transferase domain-containing protein [Anaerolineales bacterium]HRE48437.1 mannose-1-phosphate guanylyltransferase [Aggregatilineales bacterium]